MKKTLCITMILLALAASIFAASVSAAATAPSAAKNDIRIKITVGDKALTATLEDNPTTRVLLKKLPLTLPMEDLYRREMCFHFDEALPAINVRNRSYELGEIIYWPPRHSFVIMYRQNGEQFAMQHIGRVDSGVEIFAKTGNVDVTFELMP